MNHNRTRMLCEGAVLVAVAQILSFIKVFEMPYGGSVTLAMMPILLFAVRWGTAPGLMAGFVYGVLQFMFDGGFAIGWQSIIGDYLVAFTVLGLAGLAHGKKGDIVLGTIIGCVARFIVHYVVGATIWAAYMPEEYLGMAMSSPWVYSALYNALYMLPSTVAALVVFAVLAKPMAKIFRGDDLK